MSTKIVPKILAVDDVPENLFAIEQVLKKLDADFYKAKSGPEALALVMKMEFAILLLDVQMPEMDGFEVASLLHGARATRHIPIIFLTAINKERVYVCKGYESGAVDYLFKPITPVILKSKVNVFLNLFKQQKHIEEQASELKEKVSALQKAETRLKSQALDLARANTELQHYMNELQESETRFHNIITNSSNGMLVVDQDRIIRFINPSVEEIMIRAHAELIGQVFDVDFSEGISKEVEFFSPDGIKKVAVVLGIKTVWGGKKAYIISLQDITERKLQEENLRQLERQNMLDLAFKNVGQNIFKQLSLISKSVTELRSNNRDDQEQSQIALEQIEQSATLSSISLGQLGILKKHQIDSKVMNINDLVRSMESSFRVIAREQFECRLDLGNEQAFVNADEHLIKQALLNLFFIAYEGLQPGGGIIIKSVMTTIDTFGKIQTTGDSQIGNSVSFTLMSDEYDSESLIVFTPCTVHYGNLEKSGFAKYFIGQIIKLHGGIFEVEQEMKKGLAFRITLPLVPKRPIDTQRKSSTKDASMTCSTVITLRKIPLETK